MDCKHIDFVPMSAMEARLTNSKCLAGSGSVLRNGNEHVRTVANHSLPGSCISPVPLQQTLVVRLLTSIFSADASFNALILSSP